VVVPAFPCRRVKDHLPEKVSFLPEHLDANMSRHVSLWIDILIVISVNKQLVVGML